MSTGSGDKLASGSVRAQFPPAGGSITQEKWDEMFRELDIEKYRRNSDDSSTVATRADSGKNKSDSK